LARPKNNIDNSSLSPDKLKASPTSVKKRYSFKKKVSVEERQQIFKTYLNKRCRDSSNEGLVNKSINNELNYSTIDMSNTIKTINVKREGRARKLD
jgi:hypothetical protein